MVFCQYYMRVRVGVCVRASVGACACAAVRDCVPAALLWRVLAALRWAGAASELPSLEGPYFKRKKFESEWKAPDSDRRDEPQGRVRKNHTVRPLASAIVHCGQGCDMYQSIDR